MRLFLDANILFTATHNPGGKAKLVIELGSQGYWELFSSPYALEEAHRNLERKFTRLQGDLGTLLHCVHLIDIGLALTSLKALHKRTNRFFRQRWLVR